MFGRCSFWLHVLQASRLVLARMKKLLVRRHLPPGGQLGEKDVPTVWL